MHFRDTLIWLVCSVVGVGLLAVAGTQLDYINSQRQEMELISNEPLENAPPSLAFATVAMGAFRGLVVDILWMRADKLKEEGQFFDARQLAEWITKLQPRFGAVWVFHAWNMSYNISVAIPASQPDQRWRWVKNGYELLRDKGIPLNPKVIQLYHELARIFQHKIGAVSDDAHKYYKLQLAMAMEPLLGSADNEYFEALVKAPIEWAQIAGDPNVTPLIAALRSADESFAADDEFVNTYLSLRQNPKRFKPAAFETIDDFRGTPALQKFDLFAKAYRLRNTWKLDPALMQEINKIYGPVDFTDPNKHFPMDWRHPDAHAIYWAVKALREAAKKPGREIDMHETNTDRIVGHSLQNLFRNGTILIYDAPIEVPTKDGSGTQRIVQKNVFLRPDLRFFEPYNRTQLAIIEKHKDDEGRRGSLQNGHRNMLINALLSFYQAGHRRRAAQIYQQLRQLYPLEEFKVSLVEFARNRLFEELETIGINDAKEQIVMLLREGYYLYGIRSDNEAAGREAFAEQIHDYYRNKYSDANRIDLPEMRWLRYVALMDFLNDQRYPPHLRNSLLARIRIERPELYKQLEQQEQQLRSQSERTG
ncbi:MAG: hypothetical protein JSU70_13325 [Phycisphaerales bacterium]|nr:MAG: hypothetical protein JSU70_13325 [Phycisphaerales bacterium]